MENIDYTEFDKALMELEKQTKKLIEQNEKLKEDIAELKRFANYLVRKIGDIE